MVEKGIGESENCCPFFLSNKEFEFKLESLPPRLLKITSPSLDGNLEWPSDCSLDLLEAFLFPSLYG